MLDWRRSYRVALVVTVYPDEEGRPLVQLEWVKAERLKPVPADLSRRSLACGPGV